ncbi:hypothetical protein NUSPORA_00855 [Nucleospora cyclopteri]
MFCTSCCQEQKKKVVFLTGNDEYKKQFINLYGLPNNITEYTEHEIQLGSDIVVLCMVTEKVDDANIEEMHSKNSSSIVVFSSTDTPYESKKPVLFVFTKGKSSQNSSQNYTVISKEAKGIKSDFEKFVRKL